MSKLIVILILLILFIGCGQKAAEQPQTTDTEDKNTPPPPPPVAYKVGEGYPKFEDVGKSTQVYLNIYVAPGTTAEQMRSLLEYIEVYNYRSYNTLIVNLYDNEEAAGRPGMDPAMVRATLRVTRPRKPVITISGGEIPDDQVLSSAIINQGTASVYLGEKGRLFGSKDQAAWLVKLMKEKPGYAFYEVTWKAIGNVKLTYGVEQQLLVRDTEGVCRETWAGMTAENLQRAAKGGGYRGRDFPNTSYSRTPYSSPEESPAPDDKKPASQPKPE
jgi:hypothetical protein